MMKNFLIIALLALVSSILVEETSAQDPNIVADGARLWANNCMRCHNARSPRERTDREWLTIMNHMRTRANLTKTESASITAYLQMVNVPEGSNSSSAASVTASLPKSSTGLRKSNSVQNDSDSDGRNLHAFGRISADDLESLRRYFSYVRTH